MGRTIFKYRDDDDSRRKSTKSAKHSRNTPGQGMRYINNWSEEDDDWVNQSDDAEDKYSANTPQILRKGKYDGH